MKVVQFTIPVAMENSIVVQEDKLPFFYNHLHRHNEAQVTWIVKGEGTLIAGNYMQRFKQGDIYVLGANQPHIFKSDPVYFDRKKKKEVHSLTIFFNPDGLFKTILDLPETKAIRKFVVGTAYGLQVPTADQKRIAHEMLAIKNTKQGFRLAEAIRMLQMMTTIKNWKTLATISAEYSFSDNEGLRMNDVYHFTMSHFSENIKLKQVADIAYLTPQAFCRYFKKHTRKTYVAFLSEIRISEACKKIISGEYDSISSIANDTGFSSAVSFNRVFKKVTGKSPKQYLKEYQQKIG
ncbi:MAG: AraC family transcriptional regulator [Bacteroidota bacterium]